MAKKKIKEKSKKLWGGRFQESMTADVEKFTASIRYDVRLALYDIFGSIAHVKMLYKIGILTKTEAVKIDRALDKIASDIASGKVKFSSHDEDIHMAVESLLIKRIGKVGEKLHTARSRNDQVALDMRLYLKACTTSLMANIRGFQKSLLALAKKNSEVIIPEYTHLQHAQPVLLSHHLLAYMHMLDRDVDRLQDGWKRIDVLPLGAGACTGTSIPIDQKYVAGILGFKRIKQNSVDAVSDRDFVIEYLSTLSLIAMHLSRFSEEMILWASDEFGFISIGDAFSSGSSMMPQKKNPDICELIRGKTGRVYGALVSLLHNAPSCSEFYELLNELEEAKQGSGEYAIAARQAI
ncbi:argininosuccinate lyase, partial [PVC group bacterium]|nr:argininosuccinate lyase [PVC group bacterium]